jgi:hypothetical protein
MTYNILFSQQRQCFLYCEADQPQEEDVGVKSPDFSGRFFSNYWLGQIILLVEKYNDISLLTNRNNFYSRIFIFNYV